MLSRISLLTLISLAPLSISAQPPSVEEFVTELQLQQKIQLAILRQIAMQERVAQENVQQTSGLLAAALAIKNQGLNSFKNQFSAPLALMLAYGTLIEYFSAKNDANMVNTLTQSLHMLQEKQEKQDPLFQEKAFLYPQFFKDDASFAKQRETEFNKLATELQKRNVACPNFAELNKQKTSLDKV